MSVVYDVPDCRYSEVCREFGKRARCKGFKKEWYEHGHPGYSTLDREARYLCEIYGVLSKYTNVRGRKLW